MTTAATANIAPIAVGRYVKNAGGGFDWGAHPRTVPTPAPHLPQQVESVEMEAPQDGQNMLYCGAKNLLVKAWSGADDCQAARTVNLSGAWKTTASSSFPS
jgi:hypothetical protein